ncbi:MAG: amino acid ABC transporter substrate-binding protein [Armatimonadota bacterium]|nr:amino acid ABC transporter substrate-binding protein [Armatimonadota bacterium]MDW8156175.1 amino acid ABC transporter substrate-binding protein [Armatimonadota bacterium]
MKAPRWLALVGLLCGALVAASSAAPVRSIRLGAVIPLSGGLAANGRFIRAGYEFAVEYLNARGGVRLGGQRVPLELTVLDDESDPTKTVSRMESLAQMGISAYLGGVGSHLHAAAAAVAEKNQVPYCGVGFALWSIHQRGYKYLFSPFPKSPELAVETYRILNAYVPPEQRPRRVAIFAERTDWGKEQADLWVTRSREFGYEVVFRGEYTVGARDVSDLILRARAAGAELVLAVPTPVDTITMVRQMRELGFTPKAFFALRGADSIAVRQALGKDGDFWVSMPGWHHAVKYPGVDELNAWYQRRFGTPAEVAVGSAVACVQVIAAAVEDAQSTEPTKIRDAVAKVNLMTMAGRVRFRPDGTSPVPVIAHQWQNGQSVLIWPREFATAPFAYPATPFGAR